jgi:hypothetical protein
VIVILSVLFFLDRYILYMSHIRFHKSDRYMNVVKSAKEDISGCWHSKNATETQIFSMRQKASGGKHCIHIYIYTLSVNQSTKPWLSRRVCVSHWTHASKLQIFFYFSVPFSSPSYVSRLGAISYHIYPFYRSGANETSNTYMAKGQITYNVQTIW